jgi:hypothetical protein
MNQSTINKSWRNLCPEFVSDEEIPEQITKEVVELGRQLKLKNDGCRCR